MKKLIIFIIVVGTLAFIKIEHRYFYTIHDINFTVWKRLGGDCIIMPYKYYGLTVPKSDYIIASNRGAISIFVNNDLSLIFYNEAYDQKEQINFNLPNYKYNYIEYPRKEGIDSIRSYAKKQSELREYLPNIYIDIKEMYSVIDNKE